jgi:hypothetical protein
MKIQLIAAVAAVLVLSGCQTSNEADYMQIGYGPSFDVAHAQCDMRKSSVDQGFWAIGSPAFVAGAGIGNALDNAVAEDQFMRNCLILKGWKRRPVGAKSATVASAYVEPGAPKISPKYYAPGPWVNGATLEYWAASRECKAGKRSSCSTAVSLRSQLHAAGFEP